MAQVRKLAAAVAIVTALAVPARAELMLPGNFYIGAQGGWTKLLDVTNRTRVVPTT
jgi:hypothetical protein